MANDIFGDKKTLSIVKDARCLAVLDQHAAMFRDEMAQWKLNKDDAGSPALDESTKELLIRAFYEQVDSFYTASGLTTEQVYLRRIAPSGASILLESELYKCQAIQTYDGDKRRAVLNLIGSVIARAAHTAKTLGIKDTHVYSRYLSFDPSRSH